MKVQKDIDWFKKEIEPLLQEYEVYYRCYEQGDFGSLNQVLFEAKDKGGQIDYWGLGWLGIFLWDYIAEIELMNTLLNPDQIHQGDECLDKLVALLTNA
jgi:hypothetical protein